ncbi:hypothetical protein AYK21_05795 [Thermoplasmatales archaeon SG8-52-2]|nr:MAG: hypothetical protein AYK21_05795 [Thermoplasmatales archaeon SG8-52-2]
MKRGIFRQVKKFLPLVGIIVLIIIIFSLDVEKIKDAFFQIHPIYIVIALALTIPRLLIQNYYWRMIQKEQNINITFFQSLKIFLIGYFYGSWTPGFLGMVMRVPYMKEKTDEPYGKLFVNTFIEVILRQVAIYVMIAAGLLIIIIEFSDLEITKTLPIIIGIIIFIQAIVLFYFIKKERGENFFNVVVKRIIPKKLKDPSFRFVETFYKDFPKMRRLFIPFILGLITWVIIFSQEYIIVYALGASIPYLSFLLIFPVANIAGYIPVTFAGIGFRELTSIIIFSRMFGTDEEVILVFTLIGFILTDLFLGFVGFLVSLTETGKTDVADFKKILSK